MNMKFLKCGSVKEKILDILAKGIFLGVCALFFLWMVSGARANSNELSDIKFNNADDSTEIELLTKESISKENISVDFQRNFIQFSLKGVSAYPAKTVAIRNKPVEKAFSYQYQPDLARVRILLDGSSKKYSSKVSWSIDGSAIKIQIPTIPTPLKTKVASKVSSTVKDVSAMTNSLDAEELAARTELIKSSDTTIFQMASATAIGNAGTVTAPANRKEVKATGEDTPLFLKSTEERKVNIKEEKNPVSKIGVALAGILAIISLLAIGYKKYVLGGKILPQKPQQVMDVVATQSIGRQKSISIVRVMDRHLVIGVTDHSVNLLLDLGSESSIDKYLDSSPIGASFGDFLSRSSGTQSSPTLPMESTTSSQGFRQLMKKKIAGLKPLQG